MAHFQLADKQVALRAGDMTVGSGAGMDIAVAGGPPASAMAVVTMKGDGAVSVRRGFDGAPVRVNGVQLGVEPTPMMHGDKLEVAGHEFTFADDKKSGSTQFLSGAELAELAKLRAQVAAAATGKSGVPTASTGGRLVSLTDGREYPIGAKGVGFGRDASCDVVIVSGEVSRNHAEIASGPDGYYVIDTSTNGVWVNGKRVDGTQTLGRSDVIRIGPEEFRFYADKVAAPAAAPAAAAPAAAAPAATAPAQALAAAPAPTPRPAPAPVAAALPASAPSAAPQAAAPKPAFAKTADSPVVPPPRPAPAPAPAPPPTAASPAVTPGKYGSPLFWILVGVVAIGAAAAYFFFLK